MEIQEYDLLLSGGKVIDHSGGHIGKFDIAVSDGRIAAVAPTIAVNRAKRVCDVKGRIVTPGLIDLHTHIHPGGTYWGIDPDPVAWYSGVTTWIDAGSTGAFTFDLMAANLRRLRVRTAAFINISATGITARVGECRDIDICDVDLAISTIVENRTIIGGVKVRMDRANVSSHGVEPLRRALRAASTCNIPVMVHLGVPPPRIDEILELMRPGDIITHCATPNIEGIGGRGGLSNSVRQAYQRGVIFDVGHGAGGFSFDVLEGQLAGGIYPSTISTDLHTRSLYGPAYDLPTTMSKLLAVGVSLEEVVAATTARAAAAMPILQGSGSLKVGSPADISVFKLVAGDFNFTDTRGEHRHGSSLLINEKTYLNGVPLPPGFPAASPQWADLTDGQIQAIGKREDRLREMLTYPASAVPGS